MEQPHINRKEILEVKASDSIVDLLYRARSKSRELNTIVGFTLDNKTISIPSDVADLDITPLVQKFNSMGEGDVMTPEEVRDFIISRSNSPSL